MKKLLVIFLTIILSLTCFCFASCGKDDSGETSRQEAIYQIYVTYSNQIEETPKSYQAWLETTKGNKPSASIMDVKLVDNQIYACYSDQTIKQVGGSDYKARGEEFEFTLNSDLQSYTLAGRGSVTDSNVIVPSIYNDLPVTAIGNGCFYGDILLDFIQIPESIKKVGDYAFLNSGLRNITIQGENIEITSASLYGIYNLLSITMERNLTDDVLQYADDIDCPKLVQLTSRDTNAIYQYIVSNMTDDSKNFGLELRANEDSAWKNSLNTLDNGVTTYTVDGRVYLIDVKPTFNGTTVDLKDMASVTNVYPNAFYKDSRELEIVLPNTTKEIGHGAFCDSNIKTITIPNTTTVIGDSAFYNCGNLQTIIYNGTKEQWNAISKGNYWNIYAGEEEGLFTIRCSDGEIINLCD